jgi:DnaJ-class molecular chaperone
VGSRQKAELAAEVVGVSLDGLTSATLGVAYKDLIKIHHPDAGGEHEDFIRLQHAKKELVSWLDGLSGYGSGSMSSSSGSSSCGRCGGKGYVKVTRGFSTTTIKCLSCKPKE